jgi:MSHA biogenesis protein MshQ
MEQATWNGTVNEVIDSSGNAFHGRALNGAVTANASPALAGAIGTCRYGVFDGTNDYLDMGSPNFNLTNKLTVMAWVRWSVNPNSGRDWANIVSNNSNTSQDDGQFWLQHTYDNAQFEFAVKTGFYERQHVESAAVPQNGVWAHVTGVYDGAALKIYVNGVLSGTTPFTGNLWTYNSAFKLNVGRWAHSSGRWFRGNIDEVRIIPAALTPGEINLAMNSTRPCS